MDDVIFSDGDTFFNDLSKKYNQHKKGLFIVSPSGAGKTHYCKQQSEPNWIDGDDLWIGSKAQPDPQNKWWEQGLHVINRVEQRCDIVTAQAVDKGFWILGSLNYWLKPDALVIPEWDTHVKQIKHRQYSGEYDGGLTDKQLDQLKSGIDWLMKWNTDHGVPLYKSIEEAITAFTD